MNTLGKSRSLSDMPRPFYSSMCGTPKRPSPRAAAAGHPLDFHLRVQASAHFVQDKVKQVLSRVLLRHVRATKRVGPERTHGTASQVGTDRTEFDQRSLHDASDVGRDALHGRSLGIFGPANVVRRALARATRHPRFEQLVILLILASSITLALDKPSLDPEGRFKKALVRCVCVCWEAGAADIGMRHWRRYRADLGHSQQRRFPM